MTSRFNTAVNDIKTYLDQKYEEFNRPDFIPNDPISIPHQFDRKEDIEIAGFLAATLSWGQRTTIIRNSNRLLNLMDRAPYEFLTQSKEVEFFRFLKFVHRTFNGEDCIFIMNALRNLYIRYGSMELVFLEGYQIEKKISDAINSFRGTMLQTAHLPRSAKHISSPQQGSAAKRINMFLKWMVRNDGKGVDLGIWKNISTEDLMCPLDIHSGNTARKLGLLDRKQDDWKAVEELTGNLRTFDPSDPVKYDFALFGLGIIGKHYHGN